MAVEGDSGAVTDEERRGHEVHCEEASEPPRVLRRVCYLSPATITGSSCLS